jgi:hypothetical protein
MAFLPFQNGRRFRRTVVSAKRHKASTLSGSELADTQATEVALL